MATFWSKIITVQFQIGKVIFGFIIAAILGFSLYLNLTATSREPVKIVLTNAQISEELNRITSLQSQHRDIFNQLEGQRITEKDSVKTMKITEQQLQRRDILNALEGQKILITGWLNDSTKVQKK